MLTSVINLPFTSIYVRLVSGAMVDFFGQNCCNCCVYSMKWISYYQANLNSVNWIETFNLDIKVLYFFRNKKIYKVEAVADFVWFQRIITLPYIIMKTKWLCKSWRCCRSSSTRTHKKNITWRYFYDQRITFETNTINQTLAHVTK